MRLTQSLELTLVDDRFLGPDPGQKAVAQQLYQPVASLPLICPHGHVDPRLFADPDYPFGTPVDLLLIPDHYVFRMLYSQGISLEQLGIPRVDGAPVEQDHRKIWQTFADHYYLFRGTPTGLWLNHEFYDLFGIRQKLNGETAQVIYDQIAAALTSPDMQPRRMFERFNIEVLCTTDAATDTLDYHKTIAASGWQATIRPTFRPDAVVNIDTEGWRENINRLSAVSGVDVCDYPSFVAALEQRRAFFKDMGAKATDHAALTP
ncbi:MAG: glucuronate isomerase, partial [Anaerolineae bacterium]|nr:glucuronate isomerase [Anaerolineae bacterium]